MTIRSRDALIAANAASQPIQIFKNGARTTIAAIPFTTFDLSGQPGAGTLAGTSTAAGVVPTEATAGCPTINAFGGGATGYLLQYMLGCSVAARLTVYDILFKAGAYAFNAAVSLAAQPSYVSRIPLDPSSNPDYTCTELWIEAVTAFTGNPTVAFTYTSDTGVAGQATSIATGAALTVGRMMRVPLASGDHGIQKVESVTATVASAGTFNVLVLRKIATGRVGTNGADIEGADQTGMPIMFADMALMLQVTADSTAIGISETTVNIGNG